MFYPTWDNATSYPVGSIVSFNGLLYLATYYHNSASTDAPNLEMGVDPSDPAFFGSQRSWTIYGALPPGYSESPFGVNTSILTRKIDDYDDYDLFGQFAPGIYGDDAGRSIQEYAGSTNNPTTPCPANKCVVSLNRFSGSVYGTNFQLLNYLYNPVLAPSGTYYVSGPSNEPGETNTLYVWWAIQSPSLFRRAVTLNAQTGVDDFNDPIITQQTFTPTDDTYSVGASFGMTLWMAPGNQSVTFTSAYYGLPQIIEAWEIAPND